MNQKTKDEGKECGLPIEDNAEKSCCEGGKCWWHTDSNIGTRDRRPDGEKGSGD
jgi:hypothetical protein